MRNPLTKEAMADWCEKQTADKAYKYLSMDCAWGRYIQFLGLDLLDTPVERFAIRVDQFARPLPHTFAALAQRLRA